MEELIATYLTKGDDGRSYSVYEYQEYIDASSYDGEAWVPSLKRLELDDGSPVNFIDDRTLKAVRTGVTLTVEKRIEENK